jgi:hypothetical protein
VDKIEKVLECRHGDSLLALLQTVKLLFTSGGGGGGGRGKLNYFNAKKATACYRRLHVEHFLFNFTFN